MLLHGAVRCPYSGSVVQLRDSRAYSERRKVACLTSQERIWMSGLSKGSIWVYFKGGAPPPRCPRSL